MAHQATKPRLAYIDIAKGFAILCIIAGHFGIVTVNRFVYTFHVPLFFLISGYFLSTKLDLGPFMKRKARQLLVPYYVTGLAIVAFAAAIHAFMGADARSIADDSLSILGALAYGAGTPHTEPFVIRQIGLLWFLWALFISLAIVRISLKSKYPAIPVCIIAFAGLASAQYIWLPFSLQAGAFASFFVYLGYWAKQKNILSLNPSPALIIGLTLLWAYCMANHITIGVVNCNVGSNPLAAIVCLADSIGSSYLILLICKAVEKHLRPAAKFLNMVGQATLVVMCFHAIADFTFPNYLLYELMTPFGIAMPVMHIVVVTLNIIWALIGLAVTLKTPLLGRLFQLKKLTPLSPA